MIADRARHVAATAALSGCLLFANGAAAGDAAAGARLAAARCVSCHSSTEAMYPLLEGQPKAAFIALWRAFRTRERTGPAMVSLAAELSEQDVDDLAEHYAGLLPPRAAESSDSDAGRALADRLRCAGCHGPALQGTNAGAARLAGQKVRYTAWSLQLMRSGTRSHGTAASRIRFLPTSATPRSSRWPRTWRRFADPEAAAAVRAVSSNPYRTCHHWGVSSTATLIGWRMLVPSGAQRSSG